VKEFIDHLYIWLGTTSTYNAIADLHSLQITRAYATSSHSTFTSRFLVTYLNNGHSSASVLTSFLFGEYPTTVIPLNYSAISSQPPLQNSTELSAPTVMVINSRHGPHRKHSSSIISFVSVAAGTCLPSCCPETALVYSPISRSLHSNGCTRYNII
jgi:hypothetical protein